MRRTRILIAREKTRWAFPAPHVVVEEVSRITTLREALARRKPAVLLVALDLPGLGGVRGLGRLREISPATRIIAVSRRSSEREELQVLRSGARGYLSHGLPKRVFSKAIEKVQEGEIWAGRRAIGALLGQVFGAPVRTVARKGSRAGAPSLESLTAREHEILHHLRIGASNKEIASRLTVTVATVKAHLTSIFRKLDQPDRLKLALSLSDDRR